MSTLNALLQYKQMENQKEQQQVAAIGQSVNAFIKGRQTNLDNMLQMAKMKKTLQSDPLNDLLKYGKVAELANLIDDDPLKLLVKKGVNSVLGRETINQYLSPVAGGNMPDVPTVDSMMKMGMPQGNDVDSLLQGQFQREPFGKLTDVGKAQLDVAKTQAKAGIEVNKQVEAQKQKDILKTNQDMINAELKIDNTFDSWLDTVDRTMELTDVGPGVIGGTFSKVLGTTKANEFYEGFKGGLVEYAAAIGRIAMPGARATRLINLFKSTAPTEFSTVESAIQTSADSFRNGIATDMSRNPESYVEGYHKMNSDEKRNAIAEMKNKSVIFEEKFKYGLLLKAYKKNPKLLKKATMKDLSSKIRVDKSTGAKAIVFSDGSFQEF